MWHYTGPEDSTQTHPECVTEEVVTALVCGITGACDNPRGAWRVKPFRADNPPPNEASITCRVLTIVLDLSLSCINMSASALSCISCGVDYWFLRLEQNPAEEEEGSQEGSVESAEYVSDSGEMEEESEEEVGEDEEQSSPPPPPEPRTKRRHEPVTLSAPSDSECP
ncbi:hypothetical protein ZWY2020_022043 [Hordeum vulgare]|nr:hypothetical protein ZWY2020_022043 [Hordeum vulgare]